MTRSLVSLPRLSSQRKVPATVPCIGNGTAAGGISKQKLRGAGRELCCFQRCSASRTEGAGEGRLIRQRLLTTMIVVGAKGRSVLGLEPHWDHGCST